VQSANLKIYLTKLFFLLVLILISAPAYSEGFNADFEDGITYRSENKEFSFKLGGRLHYDGAYFEEDQENLESDWLVRRMRLALRVNFFTDWRISGQYKLNVDEEPIKSLFLRYSGFEKTQLMFGQMEEPFGLEKSTSSNNITFMERAMPDVLGPGTSIGFAVRRWGDNWSGGGGLFWDTYIEDKDRLSSQAERGLTARFTTAPRYYKKQRVHLGISGSSRLPSERARVRMRTRSETKVTDEKLVSTGWIKEVDSYHTGALEAAIIFYALSLQGEYTRTFVSTQQDSESRNEVFDGYYIYMSLLLTGGSRSYSVKSGAFDGIKTRGGAGAWEIGFRQSNLNLNSIVGDVLGGEQTNYTLGLNWYPHQSVRFMLNYIQVGTDMNAGNDDPKFVQFRTQIAI